MELDSLCNQTDLSCTHMKHHKTSVRLQHACDVLLLWHTLHQLSIARLSKDYAGFADESLVPTQYSKKVSS